MPSIRILDGTPHPHLRGHKELEGGMCLTSTFTNRKEIKMSKSKMFKFVFGAVVGYLGARLLSRRRQAQTEAPRGAARDEAADQAG